jgi:hypothetical protein
VTPREGKGSKDSDTLAGGSPADKILGALNRVLRSADGQWRASCPAHGGKSRSLSVREVDGRVLLHCFAGCEVADVLAAMGLQFSDLYDRPLSHHQRPVGGLSASERLALLEYESFVVLLLATDMQEGPLAVCDVERLAFAVARISLARGNSYGG